MKEADGGMEPGRSGRSPFGSPSSPAHEPAADDVRPPVVCESVPPLSPRSSVQRPPTPPRPPVTKEPTGCCPAPRPRRSLRCIHVGDPDRNEIYEYAPNIIKSTRYEWWNFFCLNLYQQFQEFSNVYFLIVMCISLVPGVSPITPITAIAPLVFVLAVAAAKDGYEDIVRRWADRRHNSELVTVLSQTDPPTWRQIKSSRLRVGDIVRVSQSDDWIGAQGLKGDVIVLACSDDDGVCFIETAQLDGETSRKPRRELLSEMSMMLSNPPVRHHCCDPEKVSKAFKTWTLNVEPPSDALYDWQGKLDVAEQDLRSASGPWGVTLEQTIWRGASVKKTDWVVAVVIYTGMDTRLGQNMGNVKLRSSGLLTRLNKAVLGIFVIKNVFMVILCLLSVVWNEEHRNDWYLGEWADQDGAATFFLNYLTWFILLSFMIPISLFVTMQLCQRIQMLLMSWDRRMLYWMKGAAAGGGYGWVGCSPKTSDLNEELAGVKFLLTDKTGTLTENDMVYRAGFTPHDLGRGEPGWATTDGEDTFRTEEFPMDTQERSLPTQLARYWAVLSLCNTVTPFGKEGGGRGVVYEGASPDEVALVKAARARGFKLCERTHSEAKIECGGETHTYHTVRELSFTPTRKMMSMIVRTPSGSLLLLCKGADSAVMKRVQWGDIDDIHQARVSLRELGGRGWRTLAFAWRRVSEQEFAAWDAQYTALRASAADAADRDLQQAAEDDLRLTMEQDMVFAGVCAYEDRLQPGVPETIQFFLNADVSVWMLTGDKLETAVYIARNCGLAARDEDSVVKCHWEAALSHSPGSLYPRADTKENRSVLVDMWECAVRDVRAAPNRARTLALDGGALDGLLAPDEDGTLLIDELAELAPVLRSAVCCRLTPNHKSAVVALLRRTQSQTVAAVGDGGNDVNMIRAAGVGIGIIGIEGRQAELASDYAVPRFRHLVPLLAVHGRYSRYRSFMCIAFSFYKNLVLSMCQVYFAFFSAYSGRTIFDSWMLAVKNTIFTGAPPLFMGCFEKDLHEEALLCPVHGPPLYKSLRVDKLYASRSFAAVWVGAAVLHGIVVFWLWFPAMKYDVVDPHGKNMGLDAHGLLLMTGVVVVVVARAWINLRHQTAVQLSSIAFSYLFYAGFICVYASIPMLCVGDPCEAHFYQLTWQVFGSSMPWFFTLVMAVGFPVLLDLAYTAGTRLLRPTLRDHVQDTFPWMKDVYARRPVCCCCSGEAQQEPWDADGADDDAGSSPLSELSRRRAQRQEPSCDMTEADSPYDPPTPQESK
eukprot:TRINITY_DN3100_c0_g1_i1.p1 TRINITY_DN3100_c0_g1~~TRINITY_DN3100_c0_g1_i1.p1  ORF type:complete len:1298 (+),score=319.38 TRINITY_DN3100_c0_g1_i1:79-3894(+)